MYFDVAEDKRMIFAIPRSEKVYIGTTDTTYTGDKDRINVTKEDVTYLLNAVHQMFPSAQITTKDIESMWAGLRPLIYQEGRSASELSRKDEIFISANGLISIAGGKLTGYRKMAEKVVDLVASHLKKHQNRSFKSCSTENILLHGANFEIPINEYIERRAGEAQQVGITPAQVKYLVDNYGTDAEVIIEKAFELHAAMSDARERILYAELLYCAENEMITSISDFLIRRTGRLYFDKPGVKKEYQLITRLLADILKLDEQQIQFQFSHFEETLTQSGATNDQ